MLGSGSRRHRGGRRLAAAAVVAALALAACGGDDDDASDDGTGPPAGATTDTSATSATSATSDEGVGPTEATDEGDSATTATAAAAPAKEGGTLRVAAGGDPTSLDPQVGPGGGDHVILYPIFDTLIRFDPKTMDPLPGLAASWTFDDPQTLRLTLNDGITFQDGTPLDAAAVKASIERFKEIHAHADLDNVMSVDADGPLDVVLHLGTPDSSLLLALADRGGMIVSPTAAADKDAFAQHPVGAGPFSFVEYRPGDRITYARYADYWGEQQPTLDGIEMRIITDRKAAANALISDQVDFAYSLDATDVGQLEDDGSIVVSGETTLWFDMVYFNQGQKPVDDARVRTAINLAIDRDEIVAGAVDGLGEPAWLPIPPSHWANDDAAVPTWPHDVEKAKALMAEAGYADGVTVTLGVIARTLYSTEAEIIKAQLEEIGINLEITTQESTAAIQQYFEAQASNAFLASWSGRPDVQLTYNRLFSKDTYQNPAHVEIPGLADVLTRAVASDDLDERAAAYADANSLITPEAPYMPLIYPRIITAYGDNVVGYVPNLLGKPNVAFLGLS